MSDTLESFSEGTSFQPLVILFCLSSSYVAERQDFEDRGSVLNAERQLLCKGFALCTRDQSCCMGIKSFENLNQDHYSYAVRLGNLTVSRRFEHLSPNHRYEPRSIAPVCDRHSPSDGRSRKCFLQGNSDCPKSSPQRYATNVG